MTEIKFKTIEELEKLKTGIVNYNQETYYKQMRFEAAKAAMGAILSREGLGGALGERGGMVASVSVRCADELLEQLGEKE